jgi:tRNA(Leu) C34 or U34 (ribose-2'-O)-methylase TrmL
LVAAAAAAAAAEFKYTPGDWLLFGAETTGLPLQGTAITCA